MINLVFTLFSAILGVAMFAVVLFSNAAGASSETAGGNVKSAKSAGQPHAFSLMAIDDVRVARSIRPERDAGRASSVRYRQPTGLQMAAQISDRRFKQL